MDESKAAWDAVGDRFTELGQHLKNQFDARSAFGEEEREKVDDALRKLTDALDTTFTAIGDTFRDPGIREELKGTAASLASAVTVTFHELKERVEQHLPNKETGAT